MKMYKSGIIVAVLLVPLVFGGVVAADESDGNTASEPTQTTQKEIKTGNEGLTLQQRIEKYKAESRANKVTATTAAEKARLQTKCKASQGRVSSLKGRITGIDTSRTQVYTNLLNRLNTLDDKLEAKQVDTTTYDQQVAELTTKIETYRTTLATYKEAVSDLAELDCTADPEAFKAALATARTTRAELIADGKAVHTYLKDTLKPTLQAIRAQLATTTKQTTTEGN